MSEDYDSGYESDEGGYEPSQEALTIGNHALSMIDGVQSLDRKPAVTNFRGEPLERWKFTARCLSPECRNGKEMIGITIELKYYYVTAIPQEDEETGEMRPSVYVVLSDGKNQPVGFWSPYVARDLGRMIEALGTNDFGASGIPVKVIASDKGKRTFFSLVPA